MKAAETWVSTKYEFAGHDRLRASRDPEQVSVSSRLIADLVASFYARAVPEHASGDLLDLGCGKAPMFELYRRYVESVTLVDWENSLHPNPHLDLVQDLNSPLELTSNRYQTVILSDVLEHIRRPQELMGEIARVLAPGGVLLMNTPFLYWLHEQPHDYYRYTTYALADFVAAAGLELVELGPVGGAPEVLADMVSKLFVRVPVLGPLAARLAQAVTMWFVGTEVGRTVSVRSGQLFPLGYRLVARKPPAG
jgi:2-polyprenyl-3-methyl-5-hydroxy-6-metoxy-1,4-benzoquinol methylase